MLRSVHAVGTHIRKTGSFTLWKELSVAILFLSRKDDNDVRDKDKIDFCSVLTHPMLSNANRTRATVGCNTKKKTRAKRAKLMFFHRELLHLVAEVAGAKYKSRSRDIARLILRAINLVADQSNQFL